MKVIRPIKINRFSREAMNNKGMSDKRVDEAIKAWDEATGGADEEYHLS